MATRLNGNGKLERIPAGATFRPRIPDREKSVELAEQFARRGASESLIRAIGGPEAVAKLLNRDGSLKNP